MTRLVLVIGGLQVPSTVAMSPAVRRAWWPAGLAWTLWAVAVLGVAALPWIDHLLRQSARPELAQLEIGTIPLVLAAVVAATVGAVAASRRPRHPVGWLLLALGLSVTASGVVDGYARYGLVARPGALPAARWMAVVSPATIYLGFACVGFVLLLTPSGSLPSPRWRWWARLAAAAPVVFLVALAVGPGLVIPPYDAVIDPVAVPALAGPVQAASPRRSPSWSPAWRSVPGRWWSGSGAPAGWTASSSAGPHQPHAGLWAAHRPARPRLRRRGHRVGPAAARQLQPDRGRRHPGRGRRLPTGPPPHPAAGRPPLQPPPLRRRPDDRRLQRPPARRARPGHLSAELLAVVEQSVQPTDVSLWLRPSPAASRR